MADPLTDPKEYASWKGKARAWPKNMDFVGIYREEDIAVGDRTTKIDQKYHGPAPKNLGEPEEVNNPTQGEQADIRAPSQESKTWAPNKAAQRGEE